MMASSIGFDWLDAKGAMRSGSPVHLDPQACPTKLFWILEGTDGVGLKYEVTGPNGESVVVATSDHQEPPRPSTSFCQGARSETSRLRIDLTISFNQVGAHGLRAVLDGQTIAEVAVVVDRQEEEQA